MKSFWLIAAFFSFLCLSFLSGCGAPPPPPLPADGISRFPTGEPLREGDIILARSYGLVGAMFAGQSLEGGKYSHGAMVYRADNGRLMMLNYRPTGMETCTPEEFFTRYYRLALVRYKGDLGAARTPGYVGTGTEGRGVAALTATSKYWLAKNAATRIPPDYHLDHDEHSAFFCLELTSTVYRDCGLPDPFHLARKAADDTLLTIANTLFKADVYEIRSPSGVLQNPAFEQVAFWERPEFDMREEALNEEIIEAMVDELSGGMTPARPRFWGRVKLRQIFFLYHLITKSMFWRPKQDLPDFIDAEVIDNAYMLYSYAAKTKEAAKKRMYAETAPTPDAPARVRRIVREEAAKQRGTYMQNTRIAQNY